MNLGRLRKVTLTDIWEHEAHNFTPWLEGRKPCSAGGYTPEQIGQLVRDTRKAMGVTQQDLALTSGIGLRFIIDLEKGKPTCQLAKVLMLLYTLGIKITLTPPATKEE